MYKKVLYNINTSLLFALHVYVVRVYRITLERRYHVNITVLSSIELACIFIPLINNIIYYLLQCGFCAAGYLRNPCNAVSVLLQKYNELSPMHLYLHRNNNKTVKNRKQQATHFDTTWRPTAHPHSYFKRRVLSNNSSTGWLTSASHNTADAPQTRSYGTWNSMPVRLLREASSVNHNFSDREREREKKDRQLDLGFQSIYQTTSEIRCEGPRRVVGATNLTAFWRMQCSLATEQSQRLLHVR